MSHRRRCILILLVVLLAGCENDVAPRSEPSAAAVWPPHARPEMVEMLRADLHAERNPADGGGRAWIESAESSPAPCTVARPGAWTVTYEAGPAGIETGGMLFFLPSPFWGWSPAQVTLEEAPGFCVVSTEAEGVLLEAQAVDQGMLGVRIGGRALRAGERVTIRYGAGPVGAVADRYAEHQSRFWISVDGNGDGVRQNIAVSPAVDVVSGPPVRLVLTGPTTATVGEIVRFTVALLDGRGNAGYPWQGEVSFDASPADLEIPDAVSLVPEQGGRVTVEGVVRRAGVHRVRATASNGQFAESNPLVVASNPARIWWGDLHGHSNFSDGTGTPEDFFTYARDVAALDVVALTDHDHWGTPFLDQQPEMWEQIRRQTSLFHQPGRFVTLLGYEWTSWIYGHRHVLYFGDEGAVLSSIDPRFETPQLLWEALRGKDALTFAHHSAGGPIPTDWSIPPDPVLEPVTEVVSVHGVSEAYDSPARIYNAVRGNFVRDALDRGYRFGFVGSGDSHDGHPGLAHLAGATGGLVAIVSPTLRRNDILAALRSRRVYATSGPRLLLRVSLDAWPMGSVIDVKDSEGIVDRNLRVRVVAPAALQEVQIVRSGAVVETVALSGERDVSLQRALSDLRAGEYVYVRVVQRDGGLGWSSPIYLSAAE